MDVALETHFAPLPTLSATGRRAPPSRARMAKPPSPAHGVLGSRRHFGRFVLLDKLGEGAMGAVYRAFDPELHREVALKVQHEHRVGARATAMSEARALARIDNPHVVRVFEVGEVDDEVYVAMELLEGVTLRQWINAAPRTVGSVLTVFSGAADGLDAAHAAGLVHGDVKPDNLFVTAAGRVVLVDFGLARPDPAQAGARAAAPGHLVGTPAYMAPEQHRGEAASPRSDQFSLAVALWEALFGERPHGSARFSEYCRRVANGDIQEPAAAARVPRVLLQALRRGLAVAPDARFQSAGEMRDDLSRLSVTTCADRWFVRAGLVVGLVAAGLAIASLALGTGPSHALRFALGAVGLLMLGRASNSSLRTAPSPRLAQVTLVAHGLLPALLFSSFAAERGFVGAAASWFPPLLAIGIVCSVLEEGVRRIVAQLVVVVGALAVVSLAWGAIEASPLPAYATPGALALRLMGVVLVAFVTLLQNHHSIHDKFWLSRLAFRRHRPAER